MIAAIYVRQVERARAYTTTSAYCHVTPRKYLGEAGGQKRRAAADHVQPSRRDAGGRWVKNADRE
jgi:hypothetical protein